MKDYHTLIIGAGPAGLFAGLYLKKKKVSFLILDSGNSFSVRDPTQPYEVSHGVGGSGLFSDGKFSYPPAASGLWQEMDLGKAEELYLWMEKIFCDCGIALKSWDTVRAGMLLPEREIKEYDSQVLDSMERKGILQYLCYQLKDSIVTNTTVISVQESGKNTFLVSADTGEQYSCTTVVLATGKKSPMDLIPGAAKSDGHPIYEMGIRVECPQKYYRPAERPPVDYKHIIHLDDNTQLRTFCSCKMGSVVQSSFDGFRITYNGDSTNPQPFSNVGILIRSSSAVSPYAQEMRETYQRGGTFRIPLREYLSGVTIVGKVVDRQITAYLPQVLFVEDAACLDASYVYGPEIERYGNYPETDRSQRIISGKRVYICGDASGKYRGLFAAFFSGLCCADAIIEEAHRSWLDDKISEFHIDTSETETMPAVFTAQSKVFFYCRDAICQYTLSRDRLPINPFRVFGYFLSDRVDRDIIRRGNNNLLQMCHELWVFGPISNGVLFEIVSAVRQKKPIHFFNIATRATEIHELQLEDISFEPEVHKKQIKKEDLIAFIRESSRSSFDESKDLQISFFDKY